MIKLEGLLLFLSIGLQLYALFDCARTPQENVRSLPKWAWLLLVILFGLFGSIGWLVKGRPARGNGGGQRRPMRDLPPDDNPDFLRGL